jgi:hypothetical protein
MMDESAVVPSGSHFCRPWTSDGSLQRISWRDRCTVTPTKYYYIDFGLSTWYRGDHPDIRVFGRSGQVKTVPELSETVLYDPSKVDVFRLGYTFLKVIEVSD